MNLMEDDGTLARGARRAHKRCTAQSLEKESLSEIHPSRDRIPRKCGAACRRLAAGHGSEGR
ncbi:hypothetical protein PSCLAVI8L_140021 [Pseudoclavibacter sp. 8L]|nr:hypothetical protein PSCLAVI8L_140021 [Pseudoclavibacter sp. 8L]